MRVEVLVSGGDQACCGEAISLGDSATYNIVALAPDAAGPSAGKDPRFMTDNHGQTPDDVPRATVTGVVVAITGVSYPHMPVAGMPGTRTADTSRPQSHEMESLGAGDDAPYSDYLVQLDISDEATLPRHVESIEQREHREHEAQLAALREQRSHDQVGIALRTLVHDIGGRNASTAHILGAETGAAVTIAPLREGAASVHWIRSAEEGNDGIRLQIGDGSWQLPATLEQLALVREFSEAAAAGRVEELVTRLSDADWQLVTRVTAADGRSWQAVTPFSGYAQQGVFVAPRQLWNKVQRGDYRYAAWR